MYPIELNGGPLHEFRKVLDFDALEYHVPVPRPALQFWPEHDTPTGNAAMPVGIYRRTNLFRYSWGLNGLLTEWRIYRYDAERSEAQATTTKPNPCDASTATSRTDGGSEDRT